MDDVQWDWSTRAIVFNYRGRLKRKLPTNVSVPANIIVDMISITKLPVHMILINNVTLINNEHTQI